jgi:hypothetical protein
MKYLVCEKWELNIPDDIVGVPSAGVRDLEPYYRRMSAKPIDVAKGCWCIEYSINRILERIGSNRVDTVVECFAGVGRASTIIHHMLNPLHHYMYDIDKNCVRALRQLGFGTAEQRDFFQGLDITSADIVFIDDDFTMNKFHTRPGWDVGLHRVFGSHPGFVLLTDAVVRMLQCHWELYSKWAKFKVRSVSDYIDHESYTMFDAYGYSITEVVCHCGAMYALMEHVPPTPIVPVVKAPPESGKTHFKPI